MTQNEHVASIGPSDSGDRAHRARNKDEPEAECATTALTRENEAKSSGGETRTLNLAGLFEENLDLRRSPNNDADLDI